VNGLETTAPDGTTTPVIAAPDEFIVSGAAPNLTHLMTRTSFAGATWWLLTEPCRDRLEAASPEEFGALYLEGVTPECLNEVELREWIRNAPSMKPMDADADALVRYDGKYRGMPDLGLSENQIDEIIAYLLTRK
jgi:cytochrome c oxidase subunit II